MTEQIGKVTLDYEYYSGTDLYTDGDIEEKLLEIVKNNDKEDYNKIISDTKDWAIMYHLSHIRKNIVDSLDIQKNMSVLEIGSGCGAITGALAKKAGKVTCIELSKRRSMINAYQNKEFDNVTIKVGNFQDIEKHIEEKFDVITLIGVFEYAGFYIDGRKPYAEFLKKISAHLKPNGKVVIAIENKLGIKYWAGCQEDHIGGFFSGIEGYEGVKGIRTFSKKELINIATESGFTELEFYYPYPDYKMPMVIYSDDYMPKKETLNLNIQNFDRDRLVLFDESKVFDSIIEAGLFGEYANSFLVIMGKEGV